MLRHTAFSCSPGGGCRSSPEGQFVLTLYITFSAGARPVILAIVVISIIQIGVGYIAKIHVLIFMRQLTYMRMSNARPYNCSISNHCKKI